MTSARGIPIYTQREQLTKWALSALPEPFMPATAPTLDELSTAYSGRMSRYGKRRDLIVHEQEPFNAETGLAALAEGPLTATDAFYVRGHGTVPEIDPDDVAAAGARARRAGAATCRSPPCARRCRSAR